MFHCAVCAKSVDNCSCPDIDEKLKAASNSRHVAVKWCRFCDKHYARCKCAEPDFYVRSGGEELPMPPGGFKMLDGSTFVVETKHHKDHDAPRSRNRTH